MNYERLTKRNEDGTTWVKCAVCDMQDKCDFTKETCCHELQDRLAELEDKIEQRTLIELPCIMQETFGEWIVYFYNDEYHAIDCYRFTTKRNAEAKLKELNGE